MNYNVWWPRMGYCKAMLCDYFNSLKIKSIHTDSKWYMWLFCMRCINFCLIIHKIKNHIFIYTYINLKCLIVSSFVSFQELLKALIGFIDVAGLYFALTQLTHRNISQNHKFQAVGLGEEILVLFIWIWIIFHIN